MLSVGSSRMTHHWLMDEVFVTIVDLPFLISGPEKGG